MAIESEEADADYYRNRISEAGTALISAGSVVELLAVTSSSRQNTESVMRFIHGPLVASIEPVTAEQALLAGEAYRQYGKGHHKAHLNLGDVFAYSLAKLKNLPLLFKGQDFVLTDITRA